MIPRSSFPESPQQPQNWQQPQGSPVNSSTWTAMSFVGLIGGICLVFGMFFMLIGAAAGDAGASIMWWILELIRIAGIVIGIVALNTYKQMPKAAPVCVLVGGAVALLPLMGWIGGIVMIVGGGIGLSKRRMLA